MVITSYLSHLSSKHKIILVLILGVALRLILFIAGTDSILQNRPELSTPLTSWRSLQEGVYIYRRGGDPYKGGVLYHSPIHLLLFSGLLPSQPELLSATIWILSDLVASISLLKLWESRSHAASAYQSRAPIIIAAYLLNPYSIASCLSRSSTSLDNAVLLGAIAQAARGNAISSSILIAIASHTSVYPILVLVPTLFLASTRGRTSASSFFPGFLAFLTTFGGITAVSIALLGQNWLRQSWGTILSVHDLTPNVGMWWYFFTEMFDHFRTFFLGVFQLHNLVYALPVCLRLKDDPLVAILVLLGVQSTWKSYPALGDLAMFGGLLSCFPEIIAELRHPLFTLSVYLYTTILLPLLHSLWLVTGAGNANFFYAATMVYGLNSSLAVVDVLSAAFKATFQERIAKEIVEDDAVQADEGGLLNWAKRNWVVVQFTSLRQ